MREPYITMVAESRVDSDARAGAHADKMNFVLLQFYSTLIINWTIHFGKAGTEGRRLVLWSP